VIVSIEDRQAFLRSLGHCVPPQAGVGQFVSPQLWSECDFSRVRMGYECLDRTAKKNRRDPKKLEWIFSKTYGSECGPVKQFGPSAARSTSHGTPF
jgi:hypothetical protein